MKESFHKYVNNYIQLSREEIDFVLVTAFIFVVILAVTSCTPDIYDEDTMPIESQNQITIYPNEIDSVLYNPFIGWVLWAHTGDSYARQPFRLVIASITWKELEPEKRTI